MKAITTFISRKSDPNGVEDETTYYGVVKEILELDYFDFQQTVFYCYWVRIEDKVNGCVIDPKTNLIYVNLEKLKRISKEVDEPFVLASQASQVFYCKDLTRNDYWHVVLDAPKKLTQDVDTYEDPLVFKGTTHEGSLDLALAGEVMDEEEESTEGMSTMSPMKGKVLARAQRLWCDRNSKYRKFNYNPYPNDEVRRTKCPKRVRPEDWERFLKLQRELRVIARREMGKATRKATKRPHTSGRRGSGRTAERLGKKNPKVLVFRIDVYLATHTRVDESSLIPELDVELEKIRNICIAEPETVSLDIDNDPIAQVCGKDTKGRTRACGLNVSQEEVLSSYHLRDQLLQKKTACLTLEEDLVHAKDKLTTMDEKLSSLALQHSM
ncbi:hypothetical protein GIB67_011371 [Kingdonia uniflora]|uniref:DUF4216 domain-containing protein n=1 Tax=Kingdonia uniflora TaxID=39325 RepID=A0A7J7LCT0_9MAGN|nr:hypothetical protein GIB67_011371 [Kingdonia uniflora]